LKKLGMEFGPDIDNGGVKGVVRENVLEMTWKN
jgi:hypothetical protein